MIEPLPPERTAPCGFASADLRPHTSHRQAEVVLRRLDGVLDLLPPPRRQARERIIGGRPLPCGKRDTEEFARALDSWRWPPVEKDRSP